MTDSQAVARMKQLTNIGDVCAVRLVEAGIDTPEKLKKLGAKETFLRMFLAHPNPNSLCACAVYALEGAITNTPWNRIPKQKKEEFKHFTAEIRKSFLR